MKNDKNKSYEFLLTKAKNEYEDFISLCAVSLSPEGVIEIAEEITYKKLFLSIIENISFSDDWVDYLAKLDSPLNFLYGVWKKAELPDSDTILSFIEGCGNTLKEEVNKMKEKFLSGEVDFYENHPEMGVVKCYSYNPEANAGGQIELQYFDYDDIKEGLNSSEDTLDYLYTTARTELTDKGEEGFEEFLSDIWKDFLLTDNKSQFTYIGSRNVSDITFLSGCAYGMFKIMGINNPYLSFLFVEDRIKIFDSNDNYINYIECRYDKEDLKEKIEFLKSVLDDKSDYQTAIWLKEYFANDISDVANKKVFVVNEEVFIGSTNADDTNVVGNYVLFSKFDNGGF